MPLNPQISRGDIWTAYNSSRTFIRDVLVISSDDFNKLDDFFQVAILDDEGSGRIHPSNSTKIRGKIVSTDLLTTIPKSHFLIKKIGASTEDMERVDEALRKQLAL